MCWPGKRATRSSSPPMAATYAASELTRARRRSNREIDVATFGLEPGHDRNLEGGGALAGSSFLDRTPEKPQTDGRDHRQHGLPFGLPVSQAPTRRICRPGDMA